MPNHLTETQVDALIAKLRAHGHTVSPIYFVNDDDDDTLTMRIDDVETRVVVMPSEFWFE
jgi:hypothetical protein